MTVYEYMQKHARGLSGGIAWPEHVFQKPQQYAAGELIDTAVDIAWERLLPTAARRYHLVIERRFNMILFRARRIPSEPALAQAA